MPVYSAEVLAEPPISGTIEEIRYNADVNCTWVKFSNISHEWVGVFGKGWYLNDISVATIFNNYEYAFIIAGGTAYIVQLIDRSLVYITKEYRLEGAIAIPGRDLVIACSSNELIYYDSNKKVYEGMITSDGVIAIPGRDLIIDGSSNKLTYFNSNKKMCVGMLTADGIKLTHCIENKLYGYMYNPYVDGWYSFVFDISEYEIIEEKFFNAGHDFFDKK